MKCIFRLNVGVWRVSRIYRPNAVMEAALNIEAIHLFVEKFVECRVKFVSDIALSLVL